MLNTPTDRMPTVEELHLWKLDLAKRVVGVGQRDTLANAEMDLAAIDELLGDLQAGEDDDDGEG